MSLSVVVMLFGSALVPLGIVIAEDVTLTVLLVPDAAAVRVARPLPQEPQLKVAVAVSGVTAEAVGADRASRAPAEHAATRTSGRRLRSDVRWEEIDMTGGTPSGLNSADPPYRCTRCILLYVRIYVPGPACRVQ